MKLKFIKIIACINTLALLYSSVVWSCPFNKDTKAEEYKLAKDSPLEAGDKGFMNLMRRAASENPAEVEEFLKTSLDWEEYLNPEKLLSMIIDHQDDIPFCMFLIKILQVLAQEDLVSVKKALESRIERITIGALREEIQSLLHSIETTNREENIGKNTVSLDYFISALVRGYIKENIFIKLDFNSSLKVRMEDYFETEMILKLQNILQELINNSIDAEAEIIEIRTEDFIDNNSQHWIVITVNDNGIGMDKETLAQARDHKFSTKGHNRGKGLSLVERFVKDYGGVLNIESEEWKGTTIHLRLPIDNFVGRPFYETAEEIINKINIEGGLKDKNSERNGSEFFVFKKDNLDFVIKVWNPNLFHTIWDFFQHTLKGYIIAKTFLRGLYAEFIYIPSAQIDYEGKPCDFHGLIAQEKLIPLDKKIILLAQEGDMQRIKELVEQKIELERRILSRGVYLQDSSLGNFGVDGNGAVLLIDLGSLTLDPGLTDKSMSDARYDIKGKLNFKTCLNKRGFILCELIWFLDSLEGINEIKKKELLTYYLDKLNLNIDEEEFIQSSTDDDIEKYLDKINGAVSNNTKKVQLDAKAVKAILNNPKDQLYNAVFECFMRNQYDSEFRRIAQLEYEKYFRNISRPAIDSFESSFVKKFAITDSITFKYVLEDFSQFLQKALKNFNTALLYVVEMADKDPNFDEDAYLSSAINYNHLKGEIKLYIEFLLKYATLEEKKSLFNFLRDIIKNSDEWKIIYDALNEVIEELGIEAYIEESVALKLFNNDDEPSHKFTPFSGFIWGLFSFALTIGLMWYLAGIDIPFLFIGITGMYGFWASFRYFYLGYMSFRALFETDYYPSLSKMLFMPIAFSDGSFDNKVFGWLYDKNEHKLINLIERHEGQFTSKYFKWLNDFPKISHFLRMFTILPLSNVPAIIMKRIKKAIPLLFITVLLTIYSSFSPINVSTAAAQTIINPTPVVEIDNTIAPRTPPELQEMHYDYRGLTQDEFEERKLNDALLLVKQYAFPEWQFLQEHKIDIEIGYSAFTVSEFRQEPFAPPLIIIDSEAMDTKDTKEIAAASVHEITHAEQLEPYPWFVAEHIKAFRLYWLEKEAYAKEDEFREKVGLPLDHENNFEHCKDQYVAKMPVLIFFQILIDGVLILGLIHIYRFIKRIIDYIKIKRKKNLFDNCQEYEKIVDRLGENEEIVLEQLKDIDTPEGLIWCNLGYKNFHDYDKVMFINIGPIFLIDKSFQEEVPVEIRKSYKDNIIYIHDLTGTIALEPFLSYTLTTIAGMFLVKDILPDKAVIDLGAGSGVLGLIALRLGARRVIGIENNKKVLKNLKENIAINGYADNKFMVISEDLAQVKNIRSLVQNESDIPEIAIANIGSTNGEYQKANKKAVNLIGEEPNIGIFIGGGYYGKKGRYSYNSARAAIEKSGFEKDILAITLRTKKEPICAFVQRRNPDDTMPKAPSVSVTKNIAGHFADHRGAINPELLEWIKQGRVIDYYFENGQWVPYRVEFRENYIPGVTDDRGEQITDTRYAIPEKEQRILNETLKECSYDELGKPVRIRIVLDEIAPAWRDDIDHSSFIHVGERASIVWFGEGLFRDLLAREEDSLRNEIFLHEKGHLEGKGGIDEGLEYINLVNRVNIRCKSISMRKVLYVNVDSKIKLGSLSDIYNEYLLRLSWRIKEEIDGRSNKPEVIKGIDLDKFSMYIANNIIRASLGNEGVWREWGEKEVFPYQNDILNKISKGINLDGDDIEVIVDSVFSLIDKAGSLGGEVIIHKIIEGSRPIISHLLLFIDVYNWLEWIVKPKDVKEFKYLSKNLSNSAFQISYTKKRFLDAITISEILEDALGIIANQDRIVKKQWLISLYEVAVNSQLKSLREVIKLYNEHFGSIKEEHDKEIRKQWLISVYNVAMNGQDESLEEVIKLHNEHFGSIKEEKDEEIRKQWLISVYNVAMHGQDDLLGNIFMWIRGEYKQIDFRRNLIGWLKLIWRLAFLNKEEGFISSIVREYMDIERTPESLSWFERMCKRLDKEVFIGFSEGDVQQPGLLSEKDIERMANKINGIFMEYKMSIDINSIKEIIRDGGKEKVDIRKLISLLKRKMKPDMVFEIAARLSEPLNEFYGDAEEAGNVIASIMFEIAKTFKLKKEEYKLFDRETEAILYKCAQLISYSGSAESLSLDENIFLLFNILELIRGYAPNIMAMAVAKGYLIGRLEDISKGTLRFVRKNLARVNRELFYKNISLKGIIDLFLTTQDERIREVIIKYFSVKGNGYKKELHNGYNLKEALINNQNKTRRSGEGAKSRLFPSSSAGGSPVLVGELRESKIRRTALGVLENEILESEQGRDRLEGIINKYRRGDTPSFIVQDINGLVDLIIGDEPLKMIKDNNGERRIVLPFTYKEAGIKDAFEQLSKMIKSDSFGFMSENRDVEVMDEEGKRYTFTAHELIKNLLSQEFGIDSGKIHLFNRDILGARGIIDKDRERYGLSNDIELSKQLVILVNENAYQENILNKDVINEMKANKIKVVVKGKYTGIYTAFATCLVWLGLEEVYDNRGNLSGSAIEALSMLGVGAEDISKIIKEVEKFGFFVLPDFVKFTELLNQYRMCEQVVEIMA